MLKMETVTTTIASLTTKEPSARPPVSGFFLEEQFDLERTDKLLVCRSFGACPVLGLGLVLLVGAVLPVNFTM